MDIDDDAEDLLEELDDIESWARAATRGPWVASSYGFSTKDSLMAYTPDGRLYPIARQLSYADATFLASCDPETVLTLVQLARKTVKRRRKKQGW